MMHKSLISIALIFSMMFIGCSDSEDESSTGANNSAQVGENAFLAPQGVKLEGTAGNGKVLAMSAGDSQEVGGFVAEGKSTDQSSTPSSELKRSTQNASLLVDARNAIAADYTNINTIATLTEQTFTSPIRFTIGEYQVTTARPMAALDLVGYILTDITNYTGMPAASSIAPTSSNFRVSMVVVLYGGQYYYIVSAVPDNLYAQYGAIAGSMVSGNNMTQTSVFINTKTDTFTGTTAATSADFLFVIDDSGSMSGEQSDISDAATAFGTAIANSGLNYHIAIIGTGTGIDDLTTNSGSSVATRVLNKIGIIDNNISAFQTNIVLGTSGSGTETGIYNAEKALSSTGILTQKYQFPRTSTALSVIIFSDEPSQYTSRASGTFNVNNNLFVQNNYKVYSFVYLNSNGQYSDLATATGGFSADLKNSTGYPAIMARIAQEAGGAASAFKLTESNVKRVRSVTVNGVAVNEAILDGWKYNVASNSIQFFGTAIPTGGDKIEVTYDYEQTSATQATDEGDYEGYTTNGFQAIELTISGNSVAGTYVHGQQILGRFDANARTFQATVKDFSGIVTVQIQGRVLDGGKVEGQLNDASSGPDDFKLTKK